MNNFLLAQHKRRQLELLSSIKEGDLVIGRCKCPQCLEKNPQGREFSGNAQCESNIVCIYNNNDNRLFRFRTNIYDNTITILEVIPAPPPPPPTYDFLTALKKFKRIRRSDWGNDWYLLIEDEYNIKVYYRAYYQHQFMPHVKELLATDWVEAEQC